jgi:DNA-binding transcriptional MerR regulator
MSEDTNQSQILMNASEVCTLLGIKESTLRKYAGILKNAGYNFHVSQTGQRGYFDKDVVILKKFISAKEHSDMTLDQAAKSIVSWVRHTDMSAPDTNKNMDNMRHDADIDELKELVRSQNSLVKELIQKIDDQQKYIDERLEVRDRKLMESLRESNDRKEQQLLEIAAAKEEKKGFWSKLFGSS